MNRLILIFAFLVSLSAKANDNTQSPIDLETNPNARAYQMSLMVFQWDQDMSSEKIEHEDLTSLLNVPRFPKQDLNENEISTAAEIEAITTPFSDYEQKLQSNVTILVNEYWTIIFADQGSQISKAFHSAPVWSEYAELVGNIDVTLGRYLESNIQLQHYEMASTSDLSTLTASNSSNNETTTILTNENTVSLMTSNTNQDSNETNFPNEEKSEPTLQFQPIKVLKLVQNNKTASKKLNYLDHPKVGVLLYFEPMEIEEAIQQQAMETLMQESVLVPTEEIFESPLELNNLSN